eukprot:12414326-Karenia_brevis.AAC.1
MLSQEMYVLSKVLHLPPSSFKRGDYFNFHAWGFCSCRSIVALAAASLIRAAKDTITVTQDCLARLDRAAQEFLPAIRYAQEYLWPDFWDSPAIAWQLGDALKGLPGYKALNGA